MEVTSVRSTILTIDIFSENTEDTAERLSCMNERGGRWAGSLLLTVVSKKDIGA